MADLSVTMRCPVCAVVVTEWMPTDRCIVVWECTGCHATIRPKPGDCCVYCSFGDKRCPFVQDDVACPDS